MVSNFERWRSDSGNEVLGEPNGQIRMRINNRLSSTGRGPVELAEMNKTLVHGCRGSVGRCCEELIT